MKLDNTKWRKSSWSSTNPQCVELHGDTPAVRDSKNPEGPVLIFSDLGSFLGAVKAGRFDQSAE